MMYSFIELMILLPSGIYIHEKEIQSLNVETTNGYYGILPNRLDCSAALPAGILAYNRKTGPALYVALDEGILVKTENSVRISVRNAAAGVDLGELHLILEKEFAQTKEKERDVRNTISKLESSIVRQFERLHKD